jgi:hypothetical protein
VGGGGVTGDYYEDIVSEDAVPCSLVDSFTFRCNLLTPFSWWKRTFYTLSFVAAS